MMHTSGCMMQYMSVEIVSARLVEMHYMTLLVACCIATSVVSVRALIIAMHYMTALGASDDCDALHDCSGCI
jgi:hypothetical protein